VAQAGTVTDAITNATSVPVEAIIRINGNDSKWDSRFAVFVIAGQEITIEAEIPGGLAQRWEGDGEFVSDASTVTAENVTPGAVQNTGSRLKWRAPLTPGSAAIVLKTTQAAGGWVEATRLNVQVMAPARDLANGRIAGYKIGNYPARVSGKPVDYVPPSGFLRAPAAQSTPISPHFNLEDFACKARHEGDRYLALEQKLIPFLEAIAARVGEEGFVSPAESNRPITIMSGYRTPAYNKSLGNVQLSRHQYGDASDIIIDTNGDGSMDDLNRDGRVNGGDARLLASWIEDLWTRPEFSDRPGGLGIYNGTDEHGPFVHVDLRGQRARWGGNGLEWSDEAVSDAGDNAKVIQTASYKKPTTVKKTVKSSRKRSTTGVRR
jgi:hypothetical protein